MNISINKIAVNIATVELNVMIFAQLFSSLHLLECIRMSLWLYNKNDVSNDVDQLMSGPSVHCELLWLFIMV